MRLSTLIICVVSCIPAMAQCPVQPRTALVDTTGKRVTIRYYNPGPRVVRAVHFIVKSSEAGRVSQPIITNFAIETTLLPKKEAQQVFANPMHLLGNSALEVQVWHVSFADHSKWTAPHENPCGVSLAQQ
jgi:hypothetical protein